MKEMVGRIQIMWLHFKLPDYKLEDKYEKESLLLLFQIT